MATGCVGNNEGKCVLVTCIVLSTFIVLLTNCRFRAVQAGSGRFRPVPESVSWKRYFTKSNSFSIDSTAF